MVSRSKDFEGAFALLDTRVELVGPGGHKVTRGTWSAEEWDPTSIRYVKKKIKC